MEDKTTYELNIKKKSNVRLFKYEIFDYLIKNNIFKPNQGIQTIQEFVNILNPNNDYNIFHYILLSNKEEDTAENKFKKFVKVINFFKKSNNNSSVLTLLERKDKIGNLPLGYIISQGNIPLYHIYETLFQKNINRCLGYKNRSNLTICFVFGLLLLYVFKSLYSTSSVFKDFVFIFFKYLFCFLHVTT